MTIVAVKISELGPMGALADPDLLPVVDTSESATKSITAGQIKTYLTSTLNPVYDNITMVTDASTEIAAPYVVIGAFPFNPTGYTALQFVTTASVTAPALVGEIQLWNVTTLSPVVTHTVTSVAPFEQTTSIPLPASNVIYEVRHRVTGGSILSDRINTAWAGLRVKTSL